MILKLFFLVVFSIAFIHNTIASVSNVFDLVIYGGTSAGVSAAVQAKRSGINAILIAPEGRIGGLTTGGLGRTDIGSKEAFGGIAREFYAAVAKWYRNPQNWTRETRDEFAARMKAVNDKRFVPHEDTMWCFEPSVALKILEGWEKRDGLKIVRGERLDRSSGGVKKKDGRIYSIRMESGKVFSAKMFIDATYEGDLMAASGVSYVVGRESNSVYGETLNGIQRKEGSHKLKSGIDPYVIKGDKSSGLLPCVEEDVDLPDGSGDNRVQAYCYRMCLTDDPDNMIAFSKPEGFNELDYELFFRNCEQGDVKYHANSGQMPNRKTDTNNDGGFSTDFIGQSSAWAEASYDEREKIARRHLKYQQGLMWVLANHPRTPPAMRERWSKYGLCKDEFTDGYGGGWQRQLYVREARRMVGEYVMTEHNCRKRVVAQRPIAFASYTMDSHHCRRYVGKDGFVHNEGDVQDATLFPRWVNGKEQPFVGFGPYGVDYGAIIPKKRECENLLVPVCLSASHISYGSIRMEPMFFSLGQSAAVAAALAVEKGNAVQDVDYGDLRKRLVAAGQKVPEAPHAKHEESSFELRSIGKVKVVYDEFAEGDSVTRYECENEKTAKILASKRKLDLLAFGDIREEKDGVLTLNRVGKWGLLVKGNVFIESFSKSRLMGERRPKSDASINVNAHPKWLDGFDRYGATMWVGGGGTPMDVPGDFEWLSNLGLGMCVSIPGGEEDEFAPGEIDWSQYDWYQAMARKYNLPYRLLTHVGRYPWGWNIDPLPHVLPHDKRYFGMPAFYYADVLTTGSMNAGVLGVPSDKYRFDARRQLAERLGGDDSFLMGYHVCEELTCGTINYLAFCAKTPSVIKEWKKWAKETLGIDDPGSVPVPEDFIPSDPKKDIDLFGEWEISVDGKKTWVKGMSNDPMLMMYSRSWHVKPPKRYEDVWLRRTFVVKDVNAARYLHVAVAAYKTVYGAPPDVTVNGIKCERLTGDFSRCYDLAPALRKGENEIVINAHGACLPGYVYLTAKPLVLYPDMTEELNAKWFNAINFASHLRVKYIEDRIKAFRRVDKVRPLKMMAVKEAQDEALDICLKYGAYFHDTGAAGGFWCPFTGARLSKAHGLPWSCEQGGPPRTVERMRQAVSYYLQYGNDAADLVFAIGDYRTKNPEVAKWCTDNIELIRAIGQLRLPQPKIAVLRSSRNFRIGFSRDMLNYDVGRGFLQAYGHEFVYVEIPDLYRESFIQRYPVIIDCATRVMTLEDAKAIKRYVEAGGTFIAFPVTGLNLPERKNARPLEEAFGISFGKEKVFSRNFGKGRIVRFGDWTPIKMSDVNGAFVQDGNVTSPIIRVLIEAGVESIIENFAPRLWGSHRESKNGVYDVLLSTRMEKDGPNVKPTVVGRSGLLLPGRGWIATVPQNYVSMQTVMAKVPRLDVAHSGVYWIKALSEIWRPLEEFREYDTTVVKKDSDVVVLRNGWTPCAPGFFGAIGYPEDAKVEFNLSTMVPDSWKDDEVDLVMHCGFVMRGLSPYGTVKVNGMGVPGYSPFKGFRQGGQFSYDVTGLARKNGGRLNISVEIDGSKSKEFPKLGGRPNGAGVTFALHRRRKAIARMSLENWLSCMNYGDTTPVKVGERVMHRYFETRFSLPSSAKGRRVFLSSSAPLRGIMINGHVLNAPDLVREIEVTKLLNENDTNLLRWVDGTLHGISSDMIDKPTDRPLGRMELLFK